MNLQQIIASEKTSFAVKFEAMLRHNLDYHKDLKDLEELPLEAYQTAGSKINYQNTNGGEPI